MESDNGLSWEEKNQLYGMACIPFFIVFFVFAAYFLFYLVQNNLAESIWDALTYFVLPSFLIGLPSSFVTFEILYHRKIKQPLILHVKRFSGRVLLTIAAMLSFCGALALSDVYLSPVVSETHTAIVGGLIWMVGFFLVLTTFREFFSKLDKGEW